MTRAVVLGRRRPGRQIGLAIRTARRVLEGADWEVESQLVDHKRELRTAAKAAGKAGVDIVVVVGGDGAVFQVVNVVAETDVVVGIIPKGTGNLVAGNLGIPIDVEKAAKVILEGEVRRIDLGRVTVGRKKRDFAVACGIGFDAVVMDATQPDQKRRWGKLAYLANAVREGSRVRDATYELTIDGERSSMTAAQVFVANFGRMASVIEPRRKIVPDDGLLDVIVVEGANPAAFVRAGWEAIRQRSMGTTGGGHAFRVRARKISIKARPRQLVEADGTVLGKTPVTIEVRPDALRVMAPPRSSG
jgi:YegS/Rv2252/BmrU family lipid kinase